MLTKDGPVGITARNPCDIVGIIRFSLVLKDSNFFPPLVGQSFQHRQSAIFDEIRLRRRFEIFEAVCLPSLIGQSDQGFNVIIVTSRNLPKWAFDRLAMLAKNLPNIYVRPYRAGANIRRVYKRSAFEMLDSAASTVATFRLDDDDGLAKGYIARLRRHLLQNNIGKTVTFSHGHQLVLSDQSLQLWTDNRKNGSAGLALVSKGGDQEIPKVTTIYCLGAHRRVGQLAPMIDDQSPYSYVQTANGYNVSERHGYGDRDKQSAVEMAKVFSKDFPHLDAQTLTRLHKPSRA